MKVRRTDDHRAPDFNEALNDPTVRAIIATRGGKGAYRIMATLDATAKTLRIAHTERLGESF